MMCPRPRGCPPSQCELGRAAPLESVVHLQKPVFQHLGDTVLPQASAGPASRGDVRREVPLDDQCPTTPSWLRVTQVDGPATWRSSAPETCFVTAPAYASVERPCHADRPAYRPTPSRDVRPRSACRVARLETSPREFLAVLSTSVASRRSQPARSGRARHRARPGNASPLRARRRPSRSRLLEPARLDLGDRLLGPPGSRPDRRHCARSHEWPRRGAGPPRPPRDARGADDETACRDPSIPRRSVLGHGDLTEACADSDDAWW